MAIDMKEKIAKAALELLKNDSKRKLTVKDIVEECNITRQTFYYHFNDVPQLFEWMLLKQFDTLFLTSFTTDPQEELKLFLLAIENGLPYFRKGMNSNYKDELQLIVKRAIYKIFDQAIERRHFYSDYPRKDMEIIRRYHCNAFMGFISEWDEKDTADLDHIANMLYMIIAGNVHP